MYFRGQFNSKFMRKFLHKFEYILLLLTMIILYQSKESIVQIDVDPILYLNVIQGGYLLFHSSLGTIIT